MTEDQGVEKTAVADDSVRDIDSKFHARLHGVATQLGGCVGTEWGAKSRCGVSGSINPREIFGFVSSPAGVQTPRVLIPYANL